MGTNLSFGILLWWWLGVAKLGVFSIINLCAVFK